MAVNVNLRIEFLSKHYLSVPTVVCGGDDGCGALVGDTDQHLKWHNRVRMIPALAEVEYDRHGAGHVKGV